MDKLSEYIEISSFNENTSLVQKGNTVYVKKCIPREITYIYKILLNNHYKNISDIIEIFEYEDISVIIEEYISGETLSDILAKKGVRSEEYTKKIIGQICDGLIFLHRHNIVHRDINPNNIMITRDGAVKIIDFNISRSVKKNATSDTVVLGTVGYAAPEQFGFTQSDTRTDLYAVGVLANVMLTGKMPNEKLYEGKLGRVIQKAIQIDSSLRYRSIIEFKHTFTNEVDEHTAPLIKALRCIPGFRTWETWKMLLALILYAVYIPLMFVFVSWSKNTKGAMITIISEFLMFVVPYILITNISGIRKHLSHKPSTAFIVALIISVVVFCAGVCLFLSNAANNL